MTGPHVRHMSHRPARECNSARYCLDCIVLTALSRLRCLGCVVLTALSWRHCLGCIVLAALSRRHCCLDCIVLTALSRLRCLDCVLSTAPCRYASLGLGSAARSSEGGGEPAGVGVGAAAAAAGGGPEAGGPEGLCAAAAVAELRFGAALLAGPAAGSTAAAAAGGPKQPAGGRELPCAEALAADAEPRSGGEPLRPAGGAEADLVGVKTAVCSGSPAERMATTPRFSAGGGGPQRGMDESPGVDVLLQVSKLHAHCHSAHNTHKHPHTQAHTNTRKHPQHLSDCQSRQRSLTARCLHKPVWPGGWPPCATWCARAC